MNISRKKFVLLFLICAFAFQFISNSLLGSEVRLFPQPPDSFLGTGSPIAWKSTVSTILYPVKIVLTGPIVPLLNLPDMPPPFLVVAFVFYWTILAMVIQYLIGIIKRSLVRSSPFLLMRPNLRHDVHAIRAACSVPIHTQI